MLRKALVILTIQSVMLHALLGCCAHHVHACEHHLGVQRASEKSHAHAEHHHDSSVLHDESECPGGQDHNGCPSPCEEGECSYVSVERSNEVGDVVMLWTVLFETCSDQVFEAEEMGQRQNSGLSQISLLSPMPLRAQMQVWQL